MNKVMKFLSVSMLVLPLLINATKPVDDEEYIRKQNSVAAEEFYWTNGLTGLVGGALAGSGCAAFGLLPNVAQGAFISGMAGLGASGVVYTMRDRENPGRKNASQIKSVTSAIVGTGIGFGAALLILSTFKR